MSTFDNWVSTLDNAIGLYGALTFILVFTLSFAVLQKSKILGEKSRRFNTLISLVLGFVAIIPHAVGGQPDIVVIIQKALPQVSLLMVAALMVLLLIGVFGKDVNIGGTGLEGWVVILSIGAVAYTFLASAGILSRPPGWLGFLVDPQTRSLLVAVLVFGIIVWFITREEEPMEKRKSLKDSMNDIFGGVIGK